jgi:hypothetical protein
MIVYNNKFAYYDLGENLFGNEGIQLIANGLMRSNCLVYLNLSTNNMTFEGAQVLF